LLADVPTDLVVKQPGCTHARSTNPTASTEPRYLRVQEFSAHQLHAGNGRAFRSLTARGGGFAID